MYLKWKWGGFQNLRSFYVSAITHFNYQEQGSNVHILLLEFRGKKSDFLIFQLSCKIKFQ